MKRTNVLTVLRSGFAVGAVVATLLQILAVLISYDVAENYFQRGAILPMLATVFAVLGAVCGTVAAFMTKADTLPQKPLFKTLPLNPVAVGCFAAAILVISYNLKNRTDDAQFPPLVTLTSVFLVIACFYAIVTAIPKLLERSTALAAFLGLFAVLACVFLNAYYYFDVTVEMNASLKISTQVGLLCAMVYFTGEIRYLLGKPMPRMFFATSSWLVSLGALSSLSVPVAYFTGKLHRIDYAAGALLVFCAMLTAVIRLYTLWQVPKAAPTLDTHDTDVTID